MKTPRLNSLIKKWKFNYVNSSINDKLFLPPEEVSDNIEYKLFSFNKIISSEEVIKEIKKEGFNPANIYELLLWKNWNNNDWVIALGSVTEVYGDRGVPYLDGHDSERRLSLSWFGDGWNAHYRFLGVRNLSSDTKKLKSSDTLSLESLDPSSPNTQLNRIEKKLDRLLNK